MTFTLKSDRFAHGSPIPSEFTCEGEDRPPPLQWSGVPKGAQSLALIVDDPDAPDPQAPKTTWVHWVLYDLPPDLAGLEGSSGVAKSGINDWNREGWGGPCPPIGRHRYFFKLYALDTKLGDLKGPTKATLERAMEGHILGKAELMGTYQKQR